MNKLLKWVAAAATAVAALGTSACIVVVLDEPTIPKSLIK